MDLAATERRKDPPLLSYLPGIALSAALAAVAMALSRLPAIGILSPLILAVLIGCALRNTLGLPRAARPGVAFSARRLLRTAIVLLGLQLGLAQVLQIGLDGLIALVVIVVATLAFTRWLGTRIGVDPRLTDLIAAGTAICGASAVLAMNTVTDANEEDVGYAVAAVTLFGTIALFAYPLLWHFLPLDDAGFGYWAGASIHEVAQVVAAAFQADDAAGRFATVVKLTRVMMLAPIVLALGMTSVSRRRDGRPAERLPLPWFAVGFAAMVVIASLLTIPPAVKSSLALTTTFLLSCALGALGLDVDVARLKAKGIRPLLLGLAASLFIAALSLAVTCLIY